MPAPTESRGTSATLRRLGTSNIRSDVQPRPAELPRVPTGGRSASYRGRTAPALATVNRFGLELKYAARHLVQFGPITTSKAKDLMRRERWSREQRAPVLDTYLRESLVAAARSIPAYRTLRRQIPESGLAEFVCQALPIISKSDLKRTPERYYPNAHRPRPWWSVGKTSGTSGSPLSIYRSVGSIAWEHAVLCQHWAWAGFKPGQRQVVLRGDHVVPLDREQPPFWFHDRFSHSLFVSTRHLNARNAPAIADAIWHFGARTLRAYPSAAHELASLSRELGLAVRFDSIITGSEPLYAVQRELIESQFGGKAFAGYGMAERVAYAAECEFGRMHVNPEYGHVEIVNAEGQPTDDEGFVVGTSFHNTAMPLIRYKLEDSARWDHAPCPCGRTFPVLEDLNGRTGDQLLDLQGVAVNPTVLTFPFKGVEGINRAQVAQVERDRWVIRLVPESNYRDADGARLLENFNNLVSTNINVELIIVETLKNLPNGKFKWVSQEWQTTPESGPPPTTPSRIASS